MADPTYPTLAERIAAAGIVLPVTQDQHADDWPIVRDADGRPILSHHQSVGAVIAAALNAAATPATIETVNVADLIREAVLAEREACAGAAYEACAPGEGPPCLCVYLNGGAYCAPDCTCGRWKLRAQTQDWCDQHNTAARAAAAIRARGERDG